MPHRLSRPLLALVALVAGMQPSPSRAEWLPNGTPVCTATSNQLTPVTAPDGAGGAIIAWYDYRSGGADIYSQRLLSSGATDPAWPAGGRALCAATGGQYSPGIVSDGAGGAIVVWHDDRGASSDIYAQRVLASGAAHPGWPANGRAICTASGDQIYPAIAPDGAGGAIITWRDDRGGPDTDIYAQRVLASGAVDPAWPADGRAVCTAPENQSVPVIAPDGAGGALVAWSDLRNGSDSDIYAHHVLASGALDVAWPADGRALCLVAYNQSGPAIVGDGSGGAIVAWYDSRNATDADIYAQHVLGAGAVDPAWPANGRALCTAAGEQYSPMLATDGAGGALLTWYDYRPGEEADVYACRILASGAADPAWPENGRALCVTVGEQATPAIVADGSGGAVAAWLDYRDGPSSDVYAHHVLPDGALDPSWAPSGAAICTSAGEQYSPALVSDGSGGVIVAWTDFRPGNYSDIYAQWLDATGGVTAVEGHGGRRLMLRSPRPNPTGADAWIELELAASSRVTVEVLDTAGRLVRTLVAAADLTAGAHRLRWDGADESQTRRPGGIYWIRARTADGATARKLALVR